MLLEVRAIGRKTPRDGRLEVSDTTFRRLSIVPALTARVGDSCAPAVLERLSCTRCAHHEGEAHDHPFVTSELFQSLVPGEHCAVELIGNELVVSRPHPLTPQAAP